MDGHPNSRFTDTGEVTLRTDEVKAEDNLALCFGTHVAFDPEAELAAKSGQAGA